MEAAHIRHAVKRYRLSPSRRDAQPRLDRIFSLMLEDRLELALELAGISPYEEVCVHSVSSRFRPRLSHTDESLATEWSLLLADTIREAADGHRSGNAVRYTSRADALLDVALSVLRGDFRRAWAWRQMGIWTGPERVTSAEAVDHTVRALIREPQFIVPVLVALARQGLIESLTRRLETVHWFALAAAALQVSNATIGVTQALEFFSVLQAAPWDVLGGTPQVRDQAHRVLEASSIAAVAVSASEDSLPALAILALLEIEPIAVRRTPAELTTLLRAIQADLAERRTTVVREATRPEANTSRPSQSAEQSTPDVDDAGEESQPARVRAEGETAYGGLLFLLTLIGELDIPLRLAEAVARRPLAWALHLLAMTLTEAAPDDAAALAFVGLPPDAKPPSLREDPPSDEELQQVHASATEVLAELMQRLARLELSADQLLRFVCVRSARILADPGWIEVHFPLRDVSTDLRRAGLDLDPGYLPWLGVVVKFLYE